MYNNTDYYGKHELQIETSVIKADPKSIEVTKHWRVWRFYSHWPWYHKLIIWVWYYCWWWGYTIRHLHRPFVIQEIF